MSELPGRDTTKPAEKQGLFAKFIIRRTDGSDAPGGKHDGCDYFVLDVTHDPHAKAALAAYAEVVRATHPLLADDMIERYGLAEPTTGNWIAAEDYHRNVRALDVALNGEEGAAQRPMLIDVLAQVEQATRELGRPVLAALAAPPQGASSESEACTQSSDSPTPILGYMVHTGDTSKAALYNTSQRADAEDAARRWKASITALTVCHGSPVPQAPQETPNALWDEIMSYAEGQKMPSEARLKEWAWQVRRLAASPLPAPQEPAALTEWRAARKAAVEAVEAYNAALRAARANDEVNGFGFTNVDREYQAMTEASNRAHRLVAPLLDALYAAPAPVDPESQGLSEPRLSDRDLIDRFDL